jgi:hypothetical protein
MRQVVEVREILTAETRRAAKPKRTAQPTQPVAPPVRFGDPESIARRGPLPDRKIRIRRRSSKKWARFTPIYQRIEGQWKRFKCASCDSMFFQIVSQENPFVYLRCAAGHDCECLVGFKTEKDD